MQFWETSCKNTKKLKTKKEDTDLVRRNPLHDLPEWLEEFTKNLGEERVPSVRDTSASSSRESGPQPPRSSMGQAQLVFVFTEGPTL